MPVGPKIPSVGQILDIADDIGLELTEEDAASFRTLMSGTIESYKRVDHYPEQKLPVKYPPTGGVRPAPEDNPYNGWYVRADSEGAESGPLAGMEIGLKDGSKHVFGPGDARLVEDVTGSGHTTGTYGDVPCVTATVPLANQ